LGGPWLVVPCQPRNTCAAVGAPHIAPTPAAVAVPRTALIRATHYARFWRSTFSATPWDGLVVEDLVGFRFRAVESQAAHREIDGFMTVPRSCPA
jgi:hypothetical protein